jgi:acetolactate synthase-1/2/3 large subunit
VNGAELVAKTIVKEGVKCVFSLPSGEILPLCEYLRDEGVEVIFTRHEQAAGNAADGYARVTRTPGVSIVAIGPGLANLMPALAQAYYACSPVVAIAGHSKFENLDRNAFEEIDGYIWVKEYTKWSRMPVFTSRLHEYVQEAFRRATSGKMGPVLLEIPKDVLNADFDGEVDLMPPENYRFTGRIACEEHYIHETFNLLQQAERPIIIAGSGLYWSKGENELIKFAEMLSIPVAVNGMGLGCIPTDHPLYAGHAPATPVLREADLIIVAGTRFDEFLGFGKSKRMFSRDAKVIQVDIDPAEVGKNRYVDVAILCDAGAYLSQLVKYAEKERNLPNFRTWAENASKITSGMKQFFDRSATDEKPLKPQKLMKELSEVIGRDDIVILDGGETTAWGLLYLNARRAGSVINSQGPLGHLGAGLPMGIAAKAAFPDRNVFVISGDGSFLFNGCEIDTAVRHNLPVIVVVVNDSAWGLVCHTRYLTTKSKERAEFGTILNEGVRYDKFAESFGAYGEFVTEPGEIKEAVKRAIDSGLPAVIDARVSLDEISPLAYLLAGVEG